MSCKRSVMSILAGAGLVVGLTMFTALRGQGQVTDPAKLAKLFSDGNYKEAYDGYHNQCLDAKTESKQAVHALHLALQCLQQLGRLKESDDLIEQTVKQHSNDWHVLFGAAQSYVTLNSYGFTIAGKFERGPHRGGGQAAHATERDRTRALQLMTQAMPLVHELDDKSEVGHFYLSFGRLLLHDRQAQLAWQLQSLTNLDELPDFQHGYNYPRAQGAPVGQDGKAVFYQIPDSWEAAKSDGERWRWCFAQAVENLPSLINNVRWQLSEFWWNQFGVHSMRNFFHPLGSTDGDAESGTYALHTLSDIETIARLATGIRRFEIPDEFNYIKLLEQITKAPQSGYEERAINRLAEIYENRRQYTKAAVFWRRSLRLHGKAQWKQQRLDQIVNNWGRFESVAVQPAREGASVEFVFRNAGEVEFKAHEIRTEKLLTDVKSYLKSNPAQIKYERFNIENIGWRIVQHDQSKYVGKQVATWTEKLKPRPDHLDKRVTVTTPLKNAGAYLLTSRVKGGNTSKIVLWVADTAIVQKQLSGKPYYFVADAVTGKPIAGANIEFFGYRQERVGNRQQFRISTTNFADKTNDSGEIVPTDIDLDKGYQWLVTARTKSRRLAYLGFRGVWRSSYHDAEYQQVKAFGITDRPVYRPGHQMKFKF